MFICCTLLFFSVTCAADFVTQQYSCLNAPVQPATPVCPGGTWDIGRQWPAQATDVSGSYLCNSEFNWILWVCSTDSTLNVTQLAVKLPEPPVFEMPLPSATIARTTTQSLDPTDAERPKAVSPCNENVQISVEDGPLVNIAGNCGVWQFDRTWTLRLASSAGRTWCTVPTDGAWSQNTFTQTVTLTDDSPPANLAAEVEPGFQSTPSIAPALPAVFHCDETADPQPPQFFADPVCAAYTIVDQVGYPQLVAADGFSTHVCGSLHYEYIWHAKHFSPCNGSSPNVVQKVTILPAPPKFSSVPGSMVITTNEPLSVGHLGAATGISPCGQAVDVTYVDEPAVQVACGKWTINRVWTVALHFHETNCILPEQYTATASQLITISDVSPPQWVYAPPPVSVPFFDNYQAQNPIPIAKEIAHPDMLALGFTSYPTRLDSQDVSFSLSAAGGCSTTLAEMKRVWTVSDACGNNQSQEQTITFLNPYHVASQSVQQWVPSARLFVYAPGVDQLDDGCFPGKRVFLNDREYDPLDNMVGIEEICGEDGWWSPHGCREIGWNDVETSNVQDLHPMPPHVLEGQFPPNIAIFTTDSLDPLLNPVLGQPQGLDYCSVPFTTSYHDDPPVKVGCGMWTIARTWKVQPHYAGCEGAYPDTLTTKQVQVITIADHTAPQWVVPPEPEVQVPFFENYQSTNSIPLAKEIAHDDMLALGLVSLPLKVSFTNGPLVTLDIGTGTCALGLASLNRAWTVSDACGNSQSFVQKIVLQHPPSNPTPTQPWRPADAGLAPADRDITAPNRLFAFVPGVEQLADGCYPGKRVVGSGAVFTGLWEADHNCSAGRWTETACRLEEQTGSSSVAVHAWPPFFADFPDNATIFTNQSLDLEGPVGGSYCGAPFVVSHHDAPPVQRSCGVWKMERTWTITPQYTDCRGTDASLETLTTRRVQAITLLDVFPPQFIMTPAQDLYVEFLEDYGPTVTGTPQVEDIAAHADMAALRLISYPITLKYEDIHVDFFTGAASHVNGMAVVSRLWTTQDVCGNTATWLQTIRVRNPNAGGHPGPLGTIGNFTVFATNNVQVLKTDFSGSIGSNAQILLQGTTPSNVFSLLTPDYESAIDGFSEDLLTFSQRLFAKKPNPCTGPTAIICTAPLQYTCKVQQWGPPLVTSVHFDTNNNLRLVGNGLVYNIFDDLDVNRWLYPPPQVAPATPPKQVISAEGFIIVNMVYSALDAQNTLLRQTFFDQRYPAGAPFVLYNLKNIPKRPIQDMTFSSTTLAGSIISQDAWNAMVFNNVLVTGQVIAVNKKVSISGSRFQGNLFVPNFQVKTGSVLQPTAVLQKERSAQIPHYENYAAPWSSIGWVYTFIAVPVMVVLLIIGVAVYLYWRRGLQLPQSPPPGMVTHF